MIAFDTDVFTEILMGTAAFVERASSIPVDQQATPIIVTEEIIRGRLNVIRQAETGKYKISIDHAYNLFHKTFRDFQRIQILSYTPQAELLYKKWRQLSIRTSTHDLRIAAICIAHKARLISRNRRDFENIPGLSVEFWG